MEALRVELSTRLLEEDDERLLDDSGDVLAHLPHVADDGGGTGDGGQIKWNNTRITELATGKLEIDLGTTMIKEDSSGKLELDLNSKQLVHTNMLTSTTVGAAGAASALPATPAFYERVLVGGVEYKRPYYPA